MKKFQFRYQRVMNVKEQVERQKEQELAEAHRTVSREQARLEDLEKKDKHCMQQIESKKSKKKINPVEMEQCYRYLTRLNEEMELQNGRIDDAKRVVEAKRQQLMDAAKEKQILEKLKERRQAAHKTEMMRKEQCVLDDVASVFHDRTKGEKTWQ